GEVVPLASWADEILQHHLPAWWRRSGERWGGGGWWLRVSLRVAQWRAGRRDAARRAAVLRHDTWLDEQLSLGGAAEAVGPRTAGKRGSKGRSLATLKP